MTVESRTDVLARAREIGPDLVALRRELHRIPEIGNHLPLTQQVLLRELTALDDGSKVVEISTGEALSSITVVIRGGAPGADKGPVVLLRGDMDALPVTEEVAVDYVSEHVGVMHACGHDLHMAGLVGAARLLLARRDELAGDVVLMFQPGEEGPGGAEPMIARRAARRQPGVRSTRRTRCTSRRRSTRSGSGTAGRARSTPPPTRPGSAWSGSAATARARTAPRTRCRPPARWSSRCRR